MTIRRCTSRPSNCWKIRSNSGARSSPTVSGRTTSSASGAVARRLASWCRNCWISTVSRPTTSPFAHPRMPAWIARDGEVRVHGLSYLTHKIDREDTLLIVDDVFDTGLSVKAIIDKLKRRLRRNLPSDLRVATAYYKPDKNLTDFEPDFTVHRTNDWLGVSTRARRLDARRDPGQQATSVADHRVSGGDGDAGEAETVTRNNAPAAAKCRSATSNPQPLKPDRRACKIPRTGGGDPAPQFARGPGRAPRPERQGGKAQAEGLVPEGRLELPLFSEPDFESGVSTNSTTPAARARILPPSLTDAANPSSVSSGPPGRLPPLVASPGVPLRSARRVDRAASSGASFSQPSDGARGWSARTSPDAGTPRTAASGRSSGVQRYPSDSCAPAGAQDHRWAGRTARRALARWWAPDCQAAREQEPANRHRAGIRSCHADGDPVGRTICTSCSPICRMVTPLARFIDAEGALPLPHVHRSGA